MNFYNIYCCIIYNPYKIICFYSHPLRQKRMFVTLSFLTVGILLTLAAMSFFDTINHIVLAASSSHSHSKNGNNNKDSSNSIQVCCVWNEELTHGVLTYSINAGNLELKHTVTNAIDQWNENIKHLNVKLVPVSTEDATRLTYT